MDSYRRAKEQYDFVASVATSIFNQLAKQNKVMLKQVATVANYDASTNQATVYFPGDLVNQSSPYKNLTGSPLIVGEKVYIIYEFGDIQQGWIFTK